MSTQGRQIIPEIKKAVIQIKGYFERTSLDETEQLKPSDERTANALGLGVATIRRIMADFNRDPDLLDMPPKNKGRPGHVMPDALQSIIREYIRSANKEGMFITLDMLRQHLIEFNTTLDINTRTLGRALDRWGFAYGKGIRSQHLKEKDHVIAARQRYLRRKRENRQGDDAIRPEVYLDESYVNKDRARINFPFLHQI